MTNSIDTAAANLDEVQLTIARSTTAYKYAIRQGHSSLREGRLDHAFQQCVKAVGHARHIMLLLSDEDTGGIEFWRDEMSHAQEITTALAVLLKARNSGVATCVVGPVVEPCIMCVHMCRYVQPHKGICLHAPQASVSGEG